MDYDSDLAVDIANRINDILRSLPPGTQPVTVMTGLCAPMARLISTLRAEDQEICCNGRSTSSGSIPDCARTDRRGRAVA